MKVKFIGLDAFYDFLELETILFELKRLEGALILFSDFNLDILSKNVRQIVEDKMFWNHLIY